MTAPLLGLLGLVLSLIVPNALAGAQWPSRAPRAAVVLWQCATLASVLSAVGVVLAAPEELITALGSGHAVAVWVLLATLTVAALIVLRLLLSLIEVTRHSRTRRARHRMLVDLLDRAEAHGEFETSVLSPGTLRVLDGPVPFAYCLPGRSPRVVLSGGALRILPPDQVAAVLAHEQAHLRSRHDVVMESFTALYRALPPSLRSRTSLDAVHLLLEMLADDDARRRYGAGPLGAALSTMGGAADALAASTRSDDGAVGRDGDTERRRRLERLVPEAPGFSVRLQFAVYALAVSILVLPTVVLVVPWLTQALPTWPL